ncbi:MAG: hypothetical protein WC596_00405 [Candidatus Shapirobacteria bacterium]
MSLPEFPCPYSTTSRHCFGTVVTCNLIENLQAPISCRLAEWLGKDSSYTNCPAYRQTLEPLTRSPNTPEFIADFPNFRLVDPEDIRAGTCTVKPLLGYKSDDDICDHIDGGVSILLNQQKVWIRIPGTVHPTLPKCSDCVVSLLNGFRLQRELKATNETSAPTLPEPLSLDDLPF